MMTKLDKRNKTQKPNNYSDNRNNRRCHCTTLQQEQNIIYFHHRIIKDSTAYQSHEGNPNLSHLRTLAYFNTYCLQILLFFVILVASLNQERKNGLQFV